MSELIWTPVKVRLGQIIKWEHNPRMSTKVQAQRLIKSERELGQIQTVAISPFDENGFCNLYDGHQRVSAWLTVKGADYEVNALQSNRHLTEDERKKVSVLLHTATGSWSWDALSSWSAADLKEWGMDKDTLKGWREDAKELTDLLNSEEESVSVDAEPQIDRAEELLAKWQVKTGDLWQIGEHRILCGDSSALENWNLLMNGEKGSLVWTDPPYGVDYGGKLENANPIAHRVRQIENDNLPPDELEILIKNSLKSCAIYTEKGASIYVASPAGTLLPSLIRAFDGSGFDFRWGLVWVKDQIVLSRADYHFKHENILYGWKPDGAHYFVDDRKQSSVFEYPRPKKSEEHPTMKPVALVEHMIKNSSKFNDIVLEPFSGSGTTMLACQNLNRKCRAIEISPAYVAVTLERMSQAFPELEIRKIESSNKKRKK